MLTKRRRSPSSRSRSSLLCGAALLSVVGIGNVRAESSDKDDAADNDPCMADAICRAHYNRARKLSKKDDYEGALDAYESAYRRKPVPWLLINLGRSQHKMGRFADAISNYQRYLTEKEASPELRKKAEQFLREAESDLAHQPTKEPKGAAPADSGSVAPGNLPPTASGTTPDKSKAATADSTGTARDGKSPAQSGAVSDPLSQLSAQPVTKPPSRLGPLFYGGLAVGGALILGGAATGIVGLTSAQTLQATPYAGALESSSLPAQQQRVRGLALATDILIPVGIVTVAVTTIVSLARKPASSIGANTRDRESVVTPAATPTETKATPVVTPVATPVVTPVATPVATPTATPAVTPSVTPVATPTATQAEPVSPPAAAAAPSTSDTPKPTP
jgi:hypothetical protein